MRKRLGGWRSWRAGPLDELSAAQARDYARFLQQVPWYRWDFTGDAQALKDAATDAFRDRERRLALGLEYRAKAAYARGIEQAVGQVGADALTLRMILAGEPSQPLPEGVTLIARKANGTEIEVPRYRALTHLLALLAERGHDFAEIAGNDDILFTALSPRPAEPGALDSLPRQGFGDFRHLFLVKVPDLAARLRGLRDAGLTLEHVHDY